jgi:electron transport complex protein RnfG
MPEAANFEPVKKGEDIIYYKAIDKEGKFIGVAFKATGKGYSGSIETMAGMTKDGIITAIKILDQNETPGLGASVAESSFTNQFTDKNIQALSQVQAITGATISSKAVIDSVKKKAEEIKGLIKNEQ